MKRWEDILLYPHPILCWSEKQEWMSKRMEDERKGRKPEWMDDEGESEERM